MTRVTAVLDGELPNDGEADDVRDGRGMASAAPEFPGKKEGVHVMEQSKGILDMQNWQRMVDGIARELPGKGAEPRWISCVPRRQRTREQDLSSGVGEWR